MRAVFLDRDGVLNRDGPGFVTDPVGLKILPGVAEAVGDLARAGLQTIVVTNQSAVARGLVSLPQLQRIHAKLRAELSRDGARLDAIYYCPHGPWDNCECRKPKPGMLLRAQNELGVHLPASFMVGDKPTDIECGAAAGCRTILVLSGLASEYQPADFAAQPDYVCADLSEAVGVILREISGRPKGPGETVEPS